MLLEWLPFLLVACVGRQLGRIRYRRRSFNMAQGAGDTRVKKRTLNSSTCKQTRNSPL
jgi:hypothetical protein